MRCALIIVAAGTAAAGCQGVIGNPANGGQSGNPNGSPEPSPSPSPPACYANDNDKVRLQLADTCQGCHLGTSNRPFFATAESFEDLLVYEPRYVVPGKPDESYLVKLLEGTGKDPYKQMPLSGDPFAVLDKNGLTKISLSAVKDWIAKLPPPSSRTAMPAVDSPTTRRLTAEELLLGLRRVMGLPELGLGAAGGVNIVLRAPDAPGLDGEACCESYFPNGNEGDASRRLEAFGAPSTIAYRGRVKDITPATIQMLIQVSQDWCYAAVGIPSNPALFKYASLTSTSAKDADAIRKNLGYLYLRFLADVPPDPVVEDLYTKVYLKYEAAGGGTAWTAVCAYLVRQPKFLML